VKRLLIVAAGIAIALSVAVSSASASITATAPPSGVPTTSANYQFLSPWACNGHGGVYSMSDPKPILIKFSWFAQTAGQVQQFFQNAYGSYTITNNAGEADHRLVGEDGRNSADDDPGDHLESDRSRDVDPQRNDDG
jgi:hypothetical protein